MDADTRGPGSRVADRLGNPPRRLFVVGGGAAALALLLDNGLRLDVPPPPPPVPTRRPAVDEALLLDVVGDLQRLVDGATAVLASGASGTVDRLRTVQRQQVRVLRGRLTNEGVPTSVIEAAVARAAAAPAVPGGTASATPTRSGATTTPSATATTATRVPIGTRADLATALAAVGPAAWERIARASAPTRTLVATAYGVRLAGARQLGAAPTTPPGSPVRPALVDRTHALVYAFEVVAAQSKGAARTRALETLAALDDLATTLAGSAPTAPPGGWSLPFPVTTPAEAQRLATAALRPATRAATELAGPSPTGATLADVAHWGGAVLALGVRWGLPLVAFPGATT